MLLCFISLSLRLIRISSSRLILWCDAEQSDTSTNCCNHAPCHNIVLSAFLSVGGGDVNLVIASSDESEALAVRDAFYTVFGKATVRIMVRHLSAFLLFILVVVTPYRISRCSKFLFSR